MNAINGYKADMFDFYLKKQLATGFGHGYSYEQCPATQYFFDCVVNRSGTFCPSPIARWDKFDKRVTKTLHEIWHSYWTIMPILYFLAIGYVVARKFCSVESNLKSVVGQFAIEFVIVTLPVLLCVNVYNFAVEYIVLVLSIGMCLLIYKTGCLKRISEKECYDLGGTRPHMLTLARATINILTVIFILAVDFGSFPKEFRKSRRFGAGLMDTGIGLFTFGMGSVSKRLNNCGSIVRLLRQIVPILLLGVARPVVMIALNYHQDEHEYGNHLTSFFTLGLTKLFGSLLSAATKNTWQLFILGLVIVSMHEISLSVGVSNFVMSTNVKRDSILRANREGICSLPGYIALYLISMSIGKWLQSSEEASGKQILRKFLYMVLCCIGVWLVVVISVPTVGIARVTCNLGYIAWILAIALTMTTLFMFVFDMVLHTLWPNLVKVEPLLQVTTQSKPKYKVTKLPTLVESINYNGLTYFIIGNILTGQVNMFLEPDNRSTLESNLILFVYMAITSFIVLIMYLKQIKIA